MCIRRKLNVFAPQANLFGLQRQDLNKIRQLKEVVLSDVVGQRLTIEFEMQ